MRSTKGINERLEDGARAMHSLVNVAAAQNRDLTEREFASFQAHEISTRSLLQERAAADRQQEAIIRMSANPHTQVLPTNGVLPSAEERIGWSPQTHYRVGRLRAFTGRDAEHDAYNSGMWLRAFVSRHFGGAPDPQAHSFIDRLGWSVTNSGSEGTGASGGYLVPAPLSNSIIATMEKVGAIRQLVAVTPMTSDTLSIPKRQGGLVVYYPGETQLIQDSTLQWSQLQMIAKKRAVAALISSELQDDALISVADRVVTEMAHSLAAKQDAEAILGDGTSDYGGVRGLLPSLGAGGVSDAAASHDTWGEIDIADITNFMGKLPDRYHAGSPMFLCSSSFYFSTLLRLHAQSGGNTISAMQGGDGGVRSFLGYPVVLTESMPTASAASTVSCLFGNFDAGCVLSERLGVRFGKSDDYAFLQDMTALKATSRYDFKVHDGGTANDAGAYVGLKTAS